MAFSTKRGRPATPKTGTDYGTPELQIRHQAGLLKEALDSFLGKGLITEGEHRAGYRLRYLHRLSFGPAHVAAYDVAAVSGRSTRKEDAPWQLARQQEYARALAVLRQYRAEYIVKEVAIFGQKEAASRAAEVLTLQAGLGALQRFFRFS